MQKAFGKKSVIFMFLFPAFLIYTAFVIVSIVWAGYYSFFDWSGVGEKVFVGFKNYAELLTQDTVFRSTVWHTIVYTIINVAIQVFGGLLFAVLLSRIKRGRVALQTLYYIPVVISSVAICQIFTKAVLCNTDWNRESDFILREPFIQVHGVDIKSADFTVCNSICRGL
ncbi:MAG: carbohydrate ABC transporter permease [Ruminococcus sp.]